MSGTDHAAAVIAALTDDERARLLNEAGLAVYVEQGDLNLNAMTGEGFAVLRAQLDGFALLSDAPGYDAGADGLRRLLERVAAMSEEVLNAKDSRLPDFQSDEERAEFLADRTREEAEAQTTLDLARRVLAQLDSDPDHLAPAAVTLHADDPAERKTAGLAAERLKDLFGLALEDAKTDEERAVIAVAHRFEALELGVTPAMVDAATLVGHRAYELAGTLGDSTRADSVNEAYSDRLRGECDSAKVAAERDAFRAWAQLADDKPRRRLEKAIEHADGLYDAFYGRPAGAS